MVWDVYGCHNAYVSEHRSARYLAIPFELAVVGVIVTGIRRSQQRVANVILAWTCSPRCGSSGWCAAFNIQRIDFGRTNAPPKGTPGYLRAVPGRPNVMIELRQPLRARGPYGIEREVRTIGLALDDLSAFEKAYALDATA